MITNASILNFIFSNPTTMWWPDPEALITLIIEPFEFTASKRSVIEPMTVQVAVYQEKQSYWWGIIPLPRKQLLIYKNGFLPEGEAFRPALETLLEKHKVLDETGINLYKKASDELAKFEQTLRSLLDEIKGKK